MDKAMESTIINAPAVDSGTKERKSYDNDRWMIFWGAEDLMKYYAKKANNNKSERGGRRRTN